MDSCRRESPVTGQTVMEAPSEEDGLVCLIIVRKSSPIEGHSRIVRRDTDFLKQEKADQGVGRGRGIGVKIRNQLNRGIC
jgi:hypothetical protein